jgi:CheY-like chemotaxis protein
MTRRVVLIDDNDNDLLFTRLMLQRAGVADDIRCHERAHDALDALARGPDHGVSLILLDINMPLMDGFGFLDAVGQLPPAHVEGLAVVMLSSSADPADRARAATYPAVRGYLTKPIDRATATSLGAWIADR